MPTKALGLHISRPFLRELALGFEPMAQGARTNFVT